MCTHVCLCCLVLVPLIKASLCFSLHSTARVLHCDTATTVTHTHLRRRHHHHTHTHTHTCSCSALRYRHTQAPPPSHIHALPLHCVCEYTTHAPLHGYHKSVHTCTHSREREEEEEQEEEEAAEEDEHEHSKSAHQQVCVCEYVCLHACLRTPCAPICTLKLRNTVNTYEYA